MFEKEKGKWEKITRAAIRPGLVSLPLTGIVSAPPKNYSAKIQNRRSDPQFYIACDSASVSNIISDWTRTTKLPDSFELKKIVVVLNPFN
jgi:hypothetical protein